MRLAYDRRILRVETRREGSITGHELALDDLADNADFIGLVRAGGIETMHTLETTLEDVFIQVTGRALTWPRF